MFSVYIFRYGIYPLTAFMPRQPPPPRPRPVTPEVAESVKSVTPEPVDIETRRVVNMMCNVKPKDDGCELLVRCKPNLIECAYWCGTNVTC